MLPAHPKMLSHSANFTNATKILESYSHGSSNSAALKKTFESGTNIITYVGHGATTYRHSILFTSKDAGKLHSSNGCLSARFFIMPSNMPWVFMVNKWPIFYTGNGKLNFLRVFQTLARGKVKIEPAAGLYTILRHSR
jgi:hypothetical protein